MTHARPAQLSRRHVLAAPLAVAAPRAAPRADTRPPAGPTPRTASSRRAPTDPLVTAVRTFTSQHADNAAREREWQQREHTLAATCAPLTLTQATRSGLPAARALRRLARRIAATRRWLQRTATRLSHTPATTLDGAFAKLDLARLLLDPGDDTLHPADTGSPADTATTDSPADAATTTATALLHTGLADARRLRLQP